jgi:hypothetical protein
MVAVAVYLASFYVFVSIFSDGLASDARWKILGVALIVAAILIGTSNTIKPPLLGLAIACCASAVVSLAGLVFWIKVTRLQALKITGSYIGFVLAYWVVGALLFGALGGHAA